MKQKISKKKLNNKRKRTKKKIIKKIYNLLGGAELPLGEDEKKNISFHFVYPNDDIFSNIDDDFNSDNFLNADYFTGKLNEKGGNLYYNIDHEEINMIFRYADQQQLTIFSIYPIKKIYVSNNVDRLTNGLFSRIVLLNEVDLSGAIHLKVIGIKSFYGNEQLTKVILGPALEQIQDLAFADCERLETVEFTNDGGNVLRIDKKAFYNCGNLKSIEINPNAKIDIPQSEAFALCHSLEEVKLPEVERIGPGTFRGCKNISKFILPNVKEGIDLSAFEDCINLDMEMTQMPMGKIANLEGCNPNIFLKFNIPLSARLLTGDEYPFELILTPKTIRNTLLNKSIVNMFKPKINIKKELKQSYPDLKKEHLTITCEGNDLSEGNNIIRFLRGEFDLNTIYITINPK